MIGSYGTKVFQVSTQNILTPRDFSLSEAVEHEEQERLGDKPAVYRKAPGLMECSFTLQLVAPFANVGQEIQFWLNTLRAQQPQTLTLGGQAWGTGRMLLTKVGVDEITLLGETPVRARVNLSFLEYVADGSDEDGNSFVAGAAVQAARIKLAEEV